MKILSRLLLAALLLGAAGAASAEIAWIDQAEDGSARVHLYFFWSQRCPHCQKALPFVQSLEREYPWLQVHSHELTSSRDNVALYVEMATELGEEARSVPAFFVCGRMQTGYDSPEGMGRELLDMARLCQGAGAARGGAAPDAHRGGALAAGHAPGGQGMAPIRLPVLGEVAPSDLSLPLFTLVIAGLDAFNPCAFFVLLFLLSLMVHARSRARMLLIGGTFVFFSGLVYFLFMAAWLNLFLVVGSAPVVTLAAGVVAVVIGLLNTKDWFWFKQGPSLAIPEGAKPGLFRRMRGLLAADNIAAMLIGTVTLALAANSYELLCTAGFPMVYTRVLTLNELSGLHYYGYLALYNLIYVLPLMAIVALFTWTLGARKLSERQGRLLKLLSGLMMLGLGLILLIAPELLSRLWVGAGLLGGALLVALVLTLLERRWTAGGDGRAA
jgi:glutaredoxin